MEVDGFVEGDLCEFLFKRKMFLDDVLGSVWLRGEGRV